MNMLDQTLINIVLSGGGLFSGWFLKVLWGSLKELKETDSRLADKVAGIEVLVAGQYVRRDDLEKLSAELFRKLDKISDKIDGKADRL